MCSPDWDNVYGQMISPCCENRREGELNEDSINQHTAVYLIINNRDGASQHMGYFPLPWRSVASQAKLNVLIKDCFHI